MTDRQNNPNNLKLIEMKIVRLNLVCTPPPDITKNNWHSCFSFQKFVTILYRELVQQLLKITTNT